MKTCHVILASLAFASVAPAEDPALPSAEARIAAREKLPRSHAMTQVSKPAPAQEQLGLDVSDVAAEPAVSPAPAMAPAHTQEPAFSVGSPGDPVVEALAEEAAPPTTALEVVAPTPTPEAETAKVLPERLDADDVMAEVVMHRPELAQCVAEIHNAAPQLSGTLAMRWTILPRGGSTDITAENAGLEVASLADCIRDEIRGWVFPEHEASQRVQFEFKY
jgi:hypothetical protein